MNRMRASLLLIVLAAGGSSIGAERDEVRFLIPFYRTPISGAYGSRWVAETNIFNGSDAAAVVTPRPLNACVITCPEWEVLFPYGSPTPFEYNSLVTAGEAAFVFVNRVAAADVRFVSRIRDTSRDADSAGTEIPIVREEQFSSKPLQLMNVPWRSGFRHTVRIYALPEIAAAEVEIRYFLTPLDPRDSIGQRTHLYTERRRLEPAASSHVPSTAIVSIEQLPQLSGATNFWMEVVPVTPELRIWAFLSVTNDETQQVTLISPNTHSF